MTETGGFVTETGVMTVRLESGSYIAYLTVPTVDRAGSQDAGAVVAEVVAGDGYEPRPTSLTPRTIAILDDDPPGISLEFDGSAVRAGERARFTLRRLGDVSEDLYVMVRQERYALDFRAGEDTSSIWTGPLRFAAGSRTQASRSATASAGYAGGRIVLTILPPSDGSYTVAAGADTITVDVASELPTAYVTAAAASVREGAVGLFDVTRIGRLDNEVSVLLSYSNSWDASPTFTGVGFGAGVGRVRVELDTANDTAADGEFVRVTIDDGEGYRRVENIAADGVDYRTAEVAVVNTDPPRVPIRAGAAPVIEGEDAVFTFEREAGRGTELTVDLAVTEEGDFILGSAPTAVTFGAQELTTTLRVPTDDDSVDLSIETQQASGGNPERLGFENNGSITARIVPAGDGRYRPPAGAGDVSATVEVRDNDEAAVWMQGAVNDDFDTVADEKAYEGDPLRFNVHRNYGDVASALTAYLTIGPRSCQDRNHGQAFNSPFLPGQPVDRIPVVFEPGETTAHFALPTAEDEIDECNHAGSPTWRREARPSGVCRP